MKDNKGTCYFWHEGMGNRGSCEIGSCLYQFLKKQENKGKKLCFTVIIVDKIKINMKCQC